MKTTKTTETAEKAIDHWMAAYAEITDLLDDMRAYHDDHYELNPDEIHYGHVGDLARYREALRDLRDSMQNLGDYATKA
jgi:hypothetical protein